MSDDDYKRDAAWVTLRALLETKQPGDRITAEEIIDATGFEEWRDFRHRIRRWARKRGHSINAVPHDGWRISLPHERVDDSERKRRAALRYEVRGFEILTRTPTERLDDRQMRRHQAAIIRSQARFELAQQHDQELRPRQIRDRPPLRTNDDDRPGDQ